MDVLKDKLSEVEMRMRAQQNAVEAIYSLDLEVRLVG